MMAIGPLILLAVIFEGVLELAFVVLLGVFWLVGFNSLMRSIVPTWKPGILLYTQEPDT